MKIFKHIQKALINELPFVVYRKPNAKELSAFFQKNNRLYTTEDYTESGFIFAPFDDKNKSVLIPKDNSKSLQEEIEKELVEKYQGKEFVVDDTFKNQHIQLVKKGVEAIEYNAFQKVVLSRKELVNTQSIDIVSVYKKLLNNYPNAMVYVWFHPKVGLWFGATPETLVKIKGNEFETMALAGTQLYNGTKHVIWGDKEKQEQQFVTDYIVENVKPLTKSIEVGAIETVKAGSLLHLKTSIKGKLISKNIALIKALHPTPAVCGIPLKTSKEFILQHENYDRSFYTGFLGELHLNNTSELFVNLRCMELEKTTASIYVGGGITKDSNPEDEWLETINKAQVIKKVL